MTVLCKLHAMQIHIVDTLSILILNQIDLLSKWPPLPNSLGKGGQRIGQKGLPPLWLLFYFDTQVCTPNKKSLIKQI